MHVKGLELPGYEPRTLHAMALGLAVNARGADHNRSGAYEADLSGELDRLDGGAAHVAAAIETEDRAAAMDSLILCKFLRGVFDGPVGGVGRRCWRPVTGWDIDGDELHETARGIVAAKHAFNRREGWTRAEDTLPARLLDVPLTLPSGREAALTRERLDAMVDAYHRDARTGHIRSRPRSCGAAMALSVPPKTDAPTVTCTIDGIEVTVPNGTTIYTAAKQAGIEIPVLCHDERYDPVGVCRMCAVDVGGRVLAAACVRPCEDGMEVTTADAKVEKQRAVLTELLMADQPDEDPKETTTGDNLLLDAGAPLRDRPRRAAAAGARPRRWTTPTRSSASTTTPASCATAASAPATTSRATTSSAAPARATRRASRSTSTTRWASRRA